MNYQKYLNAMRSTALQTLHNVGQGHTGMAISAIPIVYSIYQNMRISKSHPKWSNRDRFVLSAGHGSMSLYSLLFLSGLIPLEDLKNFRQGSSLTPGHPEYHNENFIDASTGPLGQGIAMAVGMAIAEKYLAHQYRKCPSLVDHYTYVVVGDGDLQEGICYESMSLAGKLKLNKLIVVHDSNDFQLDSAVKIVNNENLKLRMKSQNWLYLTCDNQVEHINECIQKAKKSKKPTFIEVKTIIGEGTSAANNFKAHGLKVTDEELKKANAYFQINYDNYLFPTDITDHFKSSIVERGEQAYQAWLKTYQDYQKQYPQLIKDFENGCNNIEDDKHWKNIFNTLKNMNDPVPTKTYFKEFFTLTQQHHIKNCLTLSADLASTTNCKNNEKSFNENLSSPYIMAGIREFSMAAIQNGILLHGGLRSFCGTFLSFADYMKPAIRLGAMCELPSYYILTHDSYLVGGDGPTHQPYDQLPMLRAIANVYDIRPANRSEFVAALEIAMKSHTQTFCFIMTRQNVDVKNQDCNLNDGGYFIHFNKDALYTIVATGSEVYLALKHLNEIEASLKRPINIISAPIPKLWWEKLEKEDSSSIKEMKNILKHQKGILVMEASSDPHWYTLLCYNQHIDFIQATTFGTSIDGAKLYHDKGFNLENILQKMKNF